MKWEPIEKAPKDGRNLVLLVESGDWHKGSFMTHKGKWFAQFENGCHYPVQPVGFIEPEGNQVEIYTDDGRCRTCGQILD